MKHNFLAWRLLDVGLDKSGGAILEAIEKNHKTTTEQIEAVKTQQQKSLEESNKMIVDLKGELKVVKDEGDKLRDEIKEFKAKAKTSGMFGGTGLKSFEAEIEEKLTENKEKLGKGQTFDVELNRKAVGDMSSATNLSGTIVPADTRTGIIINPYADYHMRNVIQVGRTSSDNVRHLRDNGGEGGPTTVAESATKPQMDRDLISADAPVRKVATYLRVPEEDRKSVV